MSNTAAEAERGSGEGKSLLLCSRKLRVRWNKNPDTPLPPEETAGKKIPRRAIIDIFGEECHGTCGRWSIDASGKLVREVIPARTG